MRLIIDIMLVIAAIVFWVVMSEIATGAPTTLTSYYFGNYNTETTGTIFKSELNHSRYGGETYTIKYTYHVRDQYFSSDQVSFKTNSTSQARTLTKRYPIHKNVIVFYDKSKPHYSVLEKTSLGWGVWVQLFASILMSFFSLFILPVSFIDNAYVVLEKVLRKLK